ncbi:AraC-like DNA-binding protein [Streptomyces turgidiscabies]|uniref:AraC-like DNA-binding protein n=1 Tax=Streptomyces turgidiscabies TaxID=85558 RepID=A0ABU0RZV9_9ACTN|nr:AraC-like DNA-binding protein [Streptomyces turgidiscabies]
MYEERPSRLPGAVVWTNTPTGSGVRPVLPDGCMDLLWREGRLLVAGPDTRAYVPDGAPAHWAGVRFPPGMAPALLGVPAHELRNRRVELADLWDASRVRRLSVRVDGAPDPLAALEEVALERAARTPAPDPLLGALVAALEAGRPVGRTADELGLSARQLHRRSLTAFGYGPKTLARVLRLQRALAMARSGVPFAETATRTGYADQAHLARDVRELAGMPLGKLLGGGSGGGGQRGEQVDPVAVGVEDARVPLSPHGVPGLELAPVPRPRQLLVQGVDFGG